MRWLILAAVLALSVPAAADTWPSRPIRLIVPSPPSGSGDTIGRLVAQKLSETLGQQFLVENRPGAGGLVGAETVARATADGYTLIVSGIATHVVIPALNPNTGFDPLKDFTHIALFGGPPAVLAVSRDLPANDLATFVSLATAKPGDLSYGSPGIGTHSHLIVELFQQRTSTTLTHVPYRGAGPALADLVAGRLPAASMTLLSAAEHIKAGTIRALAVTASRRVASFPDIPTYAELGYPELTATTWFALSGPANLPQEIVHRLNVEAIRAVHSPDVRQRLERDGIEPETMDAITFTAFVKAEIERWTPVVRASGARAN
jgi:tripartite-type tricarboxylate transporter receptor subunit TctC